MTIKEYRVILEVVVEEDGKEVCHRNEKVISGEECRATRFDLLTINFHKVRDQLHKYLRGEI